MSLTARNAQVYKGTAAVTYGSGSGVSNRELQGTATVTYGGAPADVLLMHCDDFTDSSSYNQTVVNSGTVVSTTVKQFGTGSIYTIGSNTSYVSVSASQLMFGTSNFTIEFWMNPATLAGQTRVMGNATSGWVSGAWVIGFGIGNNNGGLISLYVNNAGTPLLTAVTAQSTGNWYHIAVTRSGSTWTLFQNGILQATATSAASFDNGGSARPIYFGWSGTGNAGETFNGYLDEIRFMNGIAMYSSTFTVPTSPFVSYPSTALSLPGTSGNYMNLGSTNPANIDTSVSNVFVEAWFYAFSYPNSVAFIIYKGGNNINNEDFGLWVSGVYGVNWRLWNTAGAGFAGVTGSNNLNVNQWYHVAGSWDVGTKTLYTFLNGTLLGPGTLTGTPRYSASSRVQIGAANSAGFLGDYYPFNGYIQDVRIVQGGIVPKTSFTPAGVPFRLSLPPYMTSGSTVLSLAEQYFTPSWVSLPGTQGSYLDFGVPSGPYFAPTFSTFIQCWIYINSTAANAGYIIMSTATAEINYTEDWAIRLLSGGTVQFYIQNASIVTGGVTSSSTLSAGRWYHIAVSYAYNVGANGTLYMFVNGALQNSSAMSAGGPRFSPTNRITIGSRLTTLGWSPLNSYIQDLQVVRGGSVPTSTFTPAAAPFGLASPSYVSGGTTVLSLATQYYQTTANGLLPQVFLAPSGTYPSYTTTSAPVFNSSNVAFTGAGFSAGNFINFGQTTITMSLGYSIVFQFAWTGSYQPAYERIFDFGVAGGNSNAIIVYRNGTASTINFGNFTGFSAQTITSTSTFPQNTVSGTVVCVYDPASTGSLKMYVNGSLQATLNGITIIPNGSFPSSLIAASNATGADPFSNVSIYSMKFYNRVLSAAEIARTASPISSIQFTSRAILPAVLVNPGTQIFTNGGTVTVAQTALEPVNGITWTLAPTGQGVSVASSTDYALTLSTPTAVTQNLFTVSATNKAGLTTVTQFTGATPLFNQLTTTATSSAVGVYSLRSLNSVYSRVVQVRGGTAYPPTMTSATTSGYTASASSTSQAAYLPGINSNPWQAFDNSATTFWENLYGTVYGYSTTGAYVGTVSTGGAFYTTAGIYNGEWLQIQMPSAIVLQSYFIQARSGQESSKSPNTFVILGSNDGTNWTLLDTQTGVAAASYASQAVVYFTITSPGTTAYTYFRMVVQNVQSTGSIQTVNIAQWTLNPLLDFYADTFGNLTMAAGSGQTLASWLGAATGFVTKWYDQSSAGNHATQTTTGAQPQIQRATKGPGYALVYTGTQVMNAFSYTTLNNSNFTVFSASRRTASSGIGNNSNNTTDNPVWSCGLATGVTNAYPHFTYRAGTSVFQGLYGADLGFATISAFTTSATEPIRYSFNLVSSTSGQNQYLFNDPLGNPIKTQNTGLTGLPNMSTGPFSMGYNNYSPAQGTNPGIFYIGEFYEFIVFKTSLYDTSGTTGTNVPSAVQTIYQNQLSYTGT